jgi:SAM-dependent methyltransferase
VLRPSHPPEPEEEIELDAEVEATRSPPARPGAAPPPPPPGAAAAPDVPKAKKKQRPWFEDFFSDDYLRTVRAPTMKEVARECDFIQRILSLPEGSTVLDVGCGLGLHAIELTRRGCVVVGLDLSLPMLSRAADEAQDADLKINFLHGDMREMSFGGTFDVVLCWGTTFGYFDEEQNRRVIERLYASLKSGGILLLDVSNRDHVIGSQPNLVWFEGDGCVCMEETKFNFFTSRLEVKRTVMLDDGRQRDSLYSIRLYALHELGQLLHTQGFRVVQVSGMHATPGVYFGVASPRMIITAERRAPVAKPRASTPTPTPQPNTNEASRSSLPPPPPVPEPKGDGT